MQNCVQVLGKLLMEHSVAPFQLSLPILKHLLGLPVTFSDLEFVDAELHRNLCWLRNNPGAASLGLDFTVTLESFGMKEVSELVPGGKHITVTDENKRDYLKVRSRFICILGGVIKKRTLLLKPVWDNSLWWIRRGGMTSVSADVFAKLLVWFMLTMVACIHNYVLCFTLWVMF